MNWSTAVLLCIVLLLPGLQPAPAVRAQDDPPAVGDALAIWSLRSPRVFTTWTCATGRNRAAFADDGYTLRVTGRCRETSTVASIRSDSTGIVVADGEVSLDVRVPVGQERTRLFLYVRAQQDSGRGYYLMWDPGRGIADLRKSQAPDSSVSLAARDDLPVVPPERWSRLAFVLDGPRMWVTLDGQPVLTARDDEIDAGSIAVAMNRLGSLDSEIEVVSTWRDLRIAPLTAGDVARAPRIVPSLLPPPRIARPALVDTVVRDEMRSPALFWPWVCATGANVGTFGADGLGLSVTGPCSAVSTNALIEAFQPDVTIGDGEARFDFRVEQGWDRAMVSLMLVDPDPAAPSLTARVFPAMSLVALLADSRDGARVLGMREVREAGLRPDTWASLAVQRLGDRAWLVLNDEPVLAVDGAPTAPAAAAGYASRLGPLDDRTEIKVMLRDFTASTIEGGDPGRGVVRAPRPVVDPRYERILAFIRSDLVDDAGTDPPAAERRAIGLAIMDMIAETNVNLEVAPLPEMNAARFYAYRRVIYVDERLMTYTPHVATNLLLHEIVHAHQELVGQPHACVDRELNAARWNARLWRAWFGPDGKQPPGDQIEASFSAIVEIENQGRLREAVEEIYREQCAGQ